MFLFFQRTTKQESEDQSSPLTTEQVLREEALAILGRDPGNANSENPPKFYRNLNEFGFTALCLSGGGIRSAAFSLGVIQALAAHPRAPTGDTVGRAEDSLLSEFHYLSTVSGADTSEVGSPLGALATVSLTYGVTWWGAMGESW